MKRPVRTPRFAGRSRSRHLVPGFDETSPWDEAREMGIYCRAPGLGEFLKEVRSPCPCAGHGLSQAATHWLTLGGADRFRPSLLRFARCLSAQAVGHLCSSAGKRGPVRPLLLIPLAPLRRRRGWRPGSSGVAVRWLVAERSRGMRRRRWLGPGAKLCPRL
jgi:hypothetical protein